MSSSGPPRPREDFEAVRGDAVRAGDFGAARDDAARAAKTLEHWCHARGWQGSDPYDGLNADRVARRLHGSPLALRVLTQTVKRSPVNLRPWLGIAPGLSSATLAIAISAYARNGFLSDEEARQKLRDAISELQGLRCGGYSEPCWGYHFDVQTRVFFYPRTAPNTIATAFAGLGLLDAYELAQEESALVTAAGVGDFFLRHVFQTQTDSGAYFGYLAGDRTPIHNANMLVCAVLARLANILHRDDFREAAAAGVRYTVSAQRHDGSWPYGELPHLNWVDGFHTGYVLDSLLACRQAGVGGAAAQDAWQRGLRFYADATIERDGTPRYTPGSRYPIDGQCVAQALQTLSRAAQLEPEVATRRWAVLRFALERFRRRDGAFMFQRRSVWKNPAPHPRWVLAPMLVALADLIASGR